MSVAPEVRPLPSTLGRVFDGDLIRGDSAVWLVLGDTPNFQSRQQVALPDGWSEEIYRVPDIDLAPLKIVTGDRKPEPLTLEKVIRQVEALTGQKWPVSPACNDPRLETEKARLMELRDKLAAKTNELIKILATQDPANQAALTKSWLAEKAKADKEVMTALSASAAVASVIPVVGPVISALINIVAAIGGGAAVGPAPFNTSARELFERTSYRGFSAYLFHAERPVSGDTYEAQGLSMDQRNLQFVEWVDRVLDRLSQALRVPFKCIFPAWWEPLALHPPTAARLREFRNQAMRAPTEFWRVRANGSLDLEKPRFMAEFLPDPDSEAINALITGDAKNLPAGAWAQAAMAKKPT